MRFDAHQHFWRYSTAEYGWITDALGALRRDFLPGDLAVLLERHDLGGCIAKPSPVVEDLEPDLRLGQSERRACRLPLLQE